MTFSFVIPAYKNFSLIHQLLFDIFKNCSLPTEILVMDDCGTDQEFNDGMEWWVNNGMLPVQHVTNKKNLGFLLNSNKGLKKATGDIICLVSTDVRIHQDIVKYSTENLETEEWIDKDDNFYKASFMGGRLIDFDSGWNTFDGHTIQYLEGWILTAHKKDWKMIGYFDERFAPNDYEDVDMGAKMDLWGWKFLLYPEGYVSHLGAQSIPYGDERETLTKRNKELFRKKWIG